MSTDFSRWRPFERIPVGMSQSLSRLPKIIHWPQTCFMLQKHLGALMTFFEGAKGQRRVVGLVSSGQHPAQASQNRRLTVGVAKSHPL